MGGNISVGRSVAHLRFDTAVLRGSELLYHTLSAPYFVWELATSHVGLSVVVVLAVILAVRYSNSPWRRVPPGPRGLPLIGNALQLKDKAWLFKRDFKQRYGALSFFT